MGKWAVVAHPIAQAELRWRDDCAVDGIEWLNVDSDGVTKRSATWPAFAR
jgi:hypothetical protein